MSKQKLEKEWLDVVKLAMQSESNKEEFAALLKERKQKDSYKKKR